MRPTRIPLAIAMTALGVFGVLWAVYAQGVSLPPPVLQVDAPPPEKKTPDRYTLPPQPQRTKAKADPTLMIPPEVFDVPHPLPTAPSKSGSGVVPAVGAGLPPPTFPPEIQNKEAPPVSPPNLPTQDPTLAVIPTLPPEPTKMLIDPQTQDLPAPPNPRTKVETPSPPPTLLFPTPLSDTVSPAVEKPKSFVRLRSAANEITPPPLDVSTGPPISGATYVPPPPPSGYAPNPNALLNLQAPAVAVEKRGAATLRAGETQTYQIVIRNLGSAPAQQVRIEEEIPVGAKLVSADPPPQRVGSKAIWIASPLVPGSDLIASFSLRADVALRLGATTTVQVFATQPIQTTVLKPPNAANVPAIHITAPERAVVGAPVRFDVHVANPTGLPLTGVRMFGYLPEGLDTPQGRKIEMEKAVTIAPGSTKNLQMPTNAVMPGRHTVQVKVVSSAGETWATTTIDVAAGSLSVRQAEMTRLFLGREGELRVEVANGAGKPVRNVAVACLLPEGLEYLDASDRGLYQANHRTVYWLIDAMPAGLTRTLAVRVIGAKPGQYQNNVSARADGMPEIRSTGTVSLEGAASLKMRVVDRDNPLELGKDTVYEIQISNGGAAAAHNVRLQVQFAPGLVPRSAQGNTRYSVNGQTVTFEPVPTLGPGGPAVYRVSAHAQSAGDQRVRFAVVSDEVQIPLQREVSTKVY